MPTASEWWNCIYGQKQEATDYTGRHIKKASYNQYGSQYGWVLEYILPPDKGGTETPENIWIVSCETNTRRGGRITYEIDGKRYQVQKDEDGCCRVYIIGDKSNDFWECEFGNITEAEDFAGRKIYKSAYGQTESHFGWDIDHILPVSRNGKDSDNNKQIVHIKTNREKENNTTFVSDDGRQFQVQKTSKVDAKYWANKYNYSNKKYCMVEIEE